MPGEAALKALDQWRQDKSASPAGLVRDLPDEEAPETADMLLSAGELPPAVAPKYLAKATAKTRQSLAELPHDCVGVGCQARYTLQEAMLQCSKNRECAASFLDRIKTQEPLAGQVSP
jgi:hypothetical protein